MAESGNKSETTAKGDAMSKETKQDRIVRSTLDQLIEHLHELKMLESNPSCKETDVERWAQSFLRHCLGYTSSAGYSIRAQESRGRTRPDLVVQHEDQAIFVVEVKKLGFDLQKSDFRSGKAQLNEYLNKIGGVQWGLLTNGAEWRLFDFSQMQYGGVEIATFDLRSDGEQIDLGKKAVEERCYDLLDFHESSFAADAWHDLSKEAMVFSPESLAKAILSADVVKYIAKSIRGEHEFKAPHEVLTDHLYCLLEEGLNDAICGWNDEKAAEFHKYIKAQKRTTRKTKQTRKESSPSGQNEIISEQVDMAASAGSGDSGSAA